MIGWRRFGFNDLWEEMARLNREIGRVYNEAAPAAFELPGGVFPPLNVYDDGESYVVRAEVPGIDPQEIELQATSRSLSIKGERKREAGAENASFHRRERDYGVFNRSLSLPEPVNPDKIAASYKLGVLEVILPKAEEAKPKTIAVHG